MHCHQVQHVECPLIVMVWISLWGDKHHAAMRSVVIVSKPKI